jgi:hypothetical protein
MKNLVIGSILAIAALFGLPAHAQVFGTSGYDLIDKATNLGNLVVPTTVNYGNSFGGGNPAVAAGSTGVFYDDITFTIASATTDSITSTINLGNLIGISGLDARLFSGSGPYTGTAGGSVLESGWGSAYSFGSGLTGMSVVLAPINLAAGTYTLEISGTVASSGIGSYAGVLNISAIPEAGTAGLMIAGLLAVGLAVGKRRRA